MSNSTIIVNYLKDNFPMEQLRCEMYCENAIYDEIPSLMCRFSSKLDENIYGELHKCICSFQGQIEWTEFKAFKGKRVFNHCICPKRLYDKLKYQFEYEEDIDNYFSEEEYKYLCEMAIKDIPLLFQHIKNYFNPILMYVKH